MGIEPTSEAWEGALSRMASARADALAGHSRDAHAVFGRGRMSHPKGCCDRMFPYAFTLGFEEPFRRRISSARRGK
jgi:hypothetical protein